MRSKQEVNMAPRNSKRQAARYVEMRACIKTLCAQLEARSIDTLDGKTERLLKRFESTLRQFLDNARYEGVDYGN
jgi:hypothetical protein